MVVGDVLYLAQFPFPHPYEAQQSAFTPLSFRAANPIEMRVPRFPIEHPKARNNHAEAGHIYWDFIKQIGAREHGQSRQNQDAQVEQHSKGVDHTHSVFHSFSLATIKVEDPRPVIAFYHPPPFQIPRQAAHICHLVIVLALVVVLDLHKDITTRIRHWSFSNPHACRFLSPSPKLPP